MRVMVLVCKECGTEYSIGTPTRTCIHMVPRNRDMQEEVIVSTRKGSFIDKFANTQLCGGRLMERVREIGSTKIYERGNR